MSDGLARTPVLEVRGASKSFPGMKALDGVDLRLFPGEIHALMGENGAGKSTLIKVVTGAYQRDGGSVVLEGREIWPKSPLDAQGLGISTVYQEVNLVPMLSVEENISLGREPKAGWHIGWGEVRRRAVAALDRLGLSLDTAQPVSSFSLAVQQMVAIARAVALDCRVLILDEPTSSLDEAETARFFEVVRRLREEGVAILFVTHFLNQVFEVSDRVTVLRNGQLVGEFLTPDLSERDLIQHMIGREFEELAGGSEADFDSVSGEVRLAVSGLGRKGSVQGLDLEVRKGEVVGFAGLLGSGRTEALRLVYGADRNHAGGATGGTTLPGSPARAVRRHFGYCPEDRKGEGIFGELSIRENIAVVVQVKQGWLRRVSRRRQDELAARAVAELDIRTTDAEKPIGELSGGNQQKAILARWLLAEPELLLLDEPTRGIDIGTKTEILRLVRAKSKEGMSFLFVSSEWAEVLKVAHRVVFFKDLRSIGELPNRGLSEEKVAETIAAGGTGV